MEGPNLEVKREEGKSEGEWMLLEQGISIGKKVVVTGLVISTIPLVLPSILIVSSLGFAFSVPAGLVFATYSFTKKLLNKLLPIPEPSPMHLESTSMHEEEEGEGGEKEEMGGLGTQDGDMKDGEKEQMESSREGEEKRIQLVENGNELPREESQKDDVNGIKRDDEHVELPKQEGHKDEDVKEIKRDDEPVVGEEERAGGVRDVKIEGEEGEEEEKGTPADKESGKVEEPLPPPDQDQEKGNVGDSEKKKKKKKKKKDGGEEK